MRKAIKSNRAPKAIGPYSQAIKVDAGTIVFCSGQLPLDPETGNIIGTTAAEQCKRVMENILNLLADAGLDLSTVAKTTIFLADMNDFTAVNEVYGTYFEDNPPARSTVQVARLPKDARIEIEAIAVV